jgi:hypothetical protein
VKCYGEASRGGGCPLTSAVWPPSPGSALRPPPTRRPVRVASGDCDPGFATVWWWRWRPGGAGGVGVRLVGAGCLVDGIFILFENFLPRVKLYAWQTFAECATKGSRQRALCRQKYNVTSLARAALGKPFLVVFGVLTGEDSLGFPAAYRSSRTSPPDGDGDRW